MDKGDAASPSTGARDLIDQLVPGLPTGGEGGVEVRDAVTDVMDPRSATGKESSDGRIGDHRFEQLDLGATEIEVDDSGTIDEFRPAGLDSQDIAVECERGLNVGDRDAEVGDGWFHEGQTYTSRVRELRRMSGSTVEVTDATWQAEVADAKGLVVVDFWAAWCGPCRMIAPTLEALAADYAGKVKIAKLDVDANQDTAMKFNVRSIPAVLYFKDGKHVDSLIGAMPRGPFEQKIKEHLAA